ncbi:MAG: methylated-DNA--[protein]-cysteine S-methyltransferase [Spirochaetaceae bacterium]|nr:MAG: methylated-DNA--[protein]-cysteine S-methyltransferase [Spirochaetaceae bacterium]
MPASRIYWNSFASPAGKLFVAVNLNGEIIRAGFLPPDIKDEAAYVQDDLALNHSGQIENNKYACGEAEHQLLQYFSGERTNFSLKTSPKGTDFQRLVWERLRKVGHGNTMTYGELAKKIGNRNAARAVAGAVARNPIVIFIPCHRIIPIRGGIGEYALRTFPDGQGKTIKHFLLEHETKLEQETKKD